MHFIISQKTGHLLTPQLVKMWPPGTVRVIVILLSKNRENELERWPSSEHLIFLLRTWVQFSIPSAPHNHQWHHNLYLQFQGIECSLLASERAPGMYLVYITYMQATLIHI